MSKVLTNTKSSTVRGSPSNSELKNTSQVFISTTDNPTERRGKNYKVTDTVVKYFQHLYSYYTLYLTFLT